MRYFEFPEAAPGSVYKIEKYLDEREGAIRTRIGGVDRSVSELLDWQGREAKSRLARLGRLGESVERKRLQMSGSDSLRVVIYPRYPEIRYPDKTKTSTAVLRAGSLSAAMLPPMAGLDVLETRNGLVRCHREGAGKSICFVTREQLENLKKDPDVGAVEEFREEPNGAVELSTLATSAYNPGPVPGGSGLGVRAATFEFGLTTDFVSCLGIPVTYDPILTFDKEVMRHSQAAFKTLVHMAPAANFYHRRTGTYDGTEDINYLISNGIQTVSMSKARGGDLATPPRSTYSEFLTMDDFAYRYPYPVFATIAYNSGYQYEVNWQCYNAISVGNVRHTYGTTFEMANCTQAKNPPPVYGSCIGGTSGTDCAGDREMPHVVAPGIPSMGTDFATTCLGGVGSVNCGTSWSAPIVNGLAATVIAADSRLASWPEKVRATLILTAQNVESGDWSVSSDERDGAGVVSGAEAVAFAQGHTTVYQGNTAVEKGMTAGSMYASDFNAGFKRFYFRVPSSKPIGRHLRVVLTWDSNPIVGGGVNALSDLDLVVQTNGGSQTSSSWDSNVEIVDVAPANLTGGGTYYIDIAPYANRIPSGSRTDFFYYAMAWSWVKDHAP